MATAEYGAAEGIAAAPVVAGTVREAVLSTMLAMAQRLLSEQPTTSFISYANLSQLDRIERKIDIGLKMMEKTEGQVSLVLNHVYGNGPTISRVINIPKINSEQELKKLNEDLQDGCYMTEIVNDLTHMLKNISKFDNRLCTVMDLFFEREFLKECSWTWITRKKVCFSQYSRVLNLFKYAGGNEVARLTDEYVQDLKKKLYNIKPIGQTTYKKCRVFQTELSKKEA
ncbi:uncharacterized protein LOC126560727 [Anopheles maculipalpis]|uniref:uncharacterized protein LOC126560727 n=1 Tax=Anopheles maculipalpis TaxID=1496333 RepID=UPI002158FBC8|nr:uncharacterized protein LOC126560727 [Anopheles maculipalpis]